ncbi:hypothetical protein [Pseudomonas duriflava]|nr:hypothetical protein [Pseudomonas duriflava]
MRLSYSGVLLEVVQYGFQGVRQSAGSLANLVEPTSDALPLGERARKAR